MRYRALGRTGLTVSEVGFGAWGIGGDHGGAVAYGPADRAQSVLALRKALDCGVTFYDTSDFYGNGLSEELIGEAFLGRRADVVLATKAGLLADGSRSDFSARHLGQAIEGSLKRLRTDYVDLFQLHSPQIEAIGDDTMTQLAALQRAGKIRAFGLSARSPRDAKVAIERFGFGAAQVNFSIIDQRAIECGLLDAAQRAGAGIIARTPLAFGFLTGHYRADQPFHERDHRARWSLQQRELWAQAPRRFAELVARLPGQTPAQFALRFAVSHPCVSTTIPGMLTVEHVRENAGAAELPPLAEADRERAAEIYSRAQFFAGGS